MANIPDRYETQVQADPDTVYDALLDIVLENYRLRDRDDENCIVSFRTWKTKTEVVASTEEDPAGGSVLRLSVLASTPSAPWRAIPIALRKTESQSTANAVIVSVSERVRASARAAEPRSGIEGPALTGTAPGWYLDGAGTLRWWDGAQWTEHTS